MPLAKKYPVALTDAEREVLETFVSSGQKKAREITRARILLLANAGNPDSEIQALLGLSRPTVCAMRRKYAQDDYAHILDVLKDAPRTGRPIQIDTRVEAKVSMIACSDPPEGSARWTLHMIADKLIELDIIESISHESVRSVLKKTV